MLNSLANANQAVEDFYFEYLNEHFEYLNSSDILSNIFGKIHKL